MKRVLIALMLMCMCCNAVFAEGEVFSGNDDSVQGTVEPTPEDGEASENETEEGGVTGEDGSDETEPEDGGTGDVPGGEGNPEEETGSDNSESGNADGDNSDGDNSGDDNSGVDNSGDGETGEDTDVPEADFFDDMENSDKMYEISDAVIFETVPENQYGEFYGDYTISQRLSKTEEYIVYELPYWKTARITAYFYNGEEIGHFIISASTDGETFEEIIPEAEIISEEGKWHKVVYSFEKPVKTQKYIKIAWNDYTQTSLTNWGQALGSIEVYNEEAEIYEIKYLSDIKFAIPDSGEANFSLETKVCDQMGISADAEVLWQEISDTGISLAADGSLTVTSEAEDCEKEVTAYIPETEITYTVKLELMHYPPGDVNSDFKITEEDLEMAGKLYMRPVGEDDGAKRADINKNGKTDIYDLAYIAYNMEENE